MAAGIMQVGRMMATLGLNTAPFMAGAKGAMSTMRNLNVAAMMAGRAMTRFVTIPMGIAGAAAISMQKDFESSLTKIVGLVGVSQDAVDEWGEAIKRMAIETGRGPEELADAMFFIASAGIRGSEALDVLEMSAKGAAAGLGETKVIADLVTSAMNAYKNTMLTASQAVDVVTAAVREGKAPADELAAAMGKVLPIASAFQVEFNEVGAAFAAMTRTGTNAQIAATQLKAILSQMASPSEQAKKAMARANYSAEQFRSTMADDGLIDALLELNGVLHGNTAAMSDVFPNIRALMGVLDLLGDNLDANVQIFEALERSGGSLARAFEAVADTTQQKLNVAAAALKVLAIDIGEAIAGPLVEGLKMMLEKIEGVISWFSQFNDQQKLAILRIAAFTAVLGPALVLLSRFMQILSASPLLVLAGAVALVAVAIKGMRDVAMKASGEMRAMSEISKRATANYADQKTKVKALYDVARDETKELGVRKKALEELNRISPEYFGNLSTETINTKNAEIALRNYNNEMFLSARITAANQLLVEKNQELFMAQQQGMEGTVPTWKRWAYALWEGATALGVSGAHIAANTLATEDYQNEVRILKEEIAAITDFLEEGNAELLERRWLQEQVNDAAESGNKTGIKQSGYLYDLQERIKFAQGQVLSSSYKNLATKQDTVRLLQQEYNQAVLLSNLYGEMGQAQYQSQMAQMSLVYLSGEQLRNALEQIKAAEDQMRLMKLMEGGIGAVEAQSEAVRKVEERIKNAREDQLAALKEELYYAQLRAEVLTAPHKTILDQIYEEREARTRGSREWLDQQKRHMDQIKGFMGVLEFFGLQQSQVYKDAQATVVYISENIRAVTREAIETTLQAVASFAGAMQTLLNAQMNAELKAAGDNKKKREQIERKYLQRQKTWAIAQAILNMAVAVTKVLSQLGILGIPAAGIISATGAVQVGIAKAVSFKEGGIVYGETLAKVGDYPGARANPEIIAPLSDLEKMLKPPSSHGPPKQIKLVLEGREVVALIETEQLLNNTY